ncbi:De-etiolated protein 1 Det1-domain-containing protein [Gamsiella multidivaricata]|uniref:De-etiolated protein 1 Det1-domain-containing protein n=1 Tax=Gamsiella multidivaricata TaxID=101098 RepID=UPI00222112E9|nr:De-etiolated protein 1 Det1-domain-containing protein [Gamsiella multidivaricata]KAI7825094.1 De-etiolated protein 1 Det1-domain-containing protein [Gamsiella multidivaricata]
MNLFDSYSAGIPQIHRPKESLLASLRGRELGVNRGKSSVIASRRLYRSIYPNTTIHGVDCQFSNLKKFTPCGQYLIGMSKNQRAVHIYSFKGSGGPPEDRPAESLNFKDFFELKHETVVLKESEMLSKDFCLVTANGRFIIVAAVSPCTGVSSDGRAYPCSLNCIPNLDTVVFYVIELVTGKIIDKREFKNEYITIAHHTGVSLYDSLFAVMLIQSQAIQIIHIKNNGKLIDLHRIGWFNHDDDELVLARYRDFNEQFIAQQTIKSTSPFYHHGYSLKDEESGDPRAKDRFESFALAPTMSSMAEFSADATYHQVPSSSSSSIGIPSRINQANYSYISQMAYNQSYYDEPHAQTISGIKQRLMAHLFRKAFNADDGGAALRHFHLTFQQFANLVMWRMQFLDESTMLIKFGKLDCVVGRQADSTYQTAFFVFYDIRTTEILAVYDNASEEFLRLYEAWADQFCATAYTTAGRGKRHYSSTCSNNIYAKDHLKKTQYGMRHARNGGTAQAVKRSLCVLPYSPQSLSDSPYLDQALFSYDEKVISASDRQRPCQDFPIKFYLRGSGELRFKIHLFKPGMISSTSTSSSSNGGVSNSSNNNTAGVSNNTINALNGNIINTGGTNTIGTNNNAAAATTGTGSGGMMRSKRFATFIAHPFEPFIISIIQYHLQPTVLNLHLYRPDAEPL